MAKKISIRSIEALDSRDMLGKLIDFPSQLRAALFISDNVKVPEKYKRKYSSIVFLGLGGSSIGADLIRTYLVDECPIPIHIVRDYHIPEFVNKDTLVFAVSYSGNTEETLSMVKNAVKKKAKIIAVTSGGTLSHLSKNNKLLTIVIPDGMPPRCALGYTLVPPLMVLGKLGIIKNKRKDIVEAIDVLSDAVETDFSCTSGKSKALSLASRLYGKVPVIHAGPKHTDVIALRWRGQINENAKTYASSNIYPELNHNEIVGWYNPYSMLKKFIIVALKDKDDYSKITKRIDVTNGIFKKAGFQIVEVESKGKKLFSRMMYLVLLGDFVSFYLAIMTKIDPTPIGRISYLKKKLKE